MRMKIKVSRKITRERVLEMIEWERLHQMKFPFMEEEDEDARPDIGNISARGPEFSDRGRSGGVG
jgi:hypothetical protein